MLIGVTDTLGSEHKFKQYLDWLGGGMKDVSTLTLSYTLDNLDALKSCHALVLTGGHDVDPALYRSSMQGHTMGPVDRKRDDFECSALENALNAGLPVLGICRGLQLANVFFGGTLIPDLEDAGFRSHRSESDSMGCYHPLVVESESELAKIAGERAGTVNSSHHQAVDAEGKGLRAVARSDDGVIEAMERVGAHREPFFLLVQWHPERMSDGNNPFSKYILRQFLTAANVTLK